MVLNLHLVGGVQELKVRVPASSVFPAPENSGHAEQIFLGTQQMRCHISNRPPRAFSIQLPLFGSERLEGITHSSHDGWVGGARIGLS